MQNVSFNAAVDTLTAVMLKMLFTDLYIYLQPWAEPRCDGVNLVSEAKMILKWSRLT